MKTYEAEDRRHVYAWSPHGILVIERQGHWSAFYRLRFYDAQLPTILPTRLVLTGFRHGSPPAELVVDFITLGDIENNILAEAKKQS